MATLGAVEKEPFPYLTFGAVAGRSERVRNANRVLLEAVVSLPVAAVMTIGPIMPRDALDVAPPSVTVETSAPQAEAMPYASAAVCHGGLGTLVSIPAARRPVVVVPLFADQPYNARSAEAPGAGFAVFEHDAHAIAEAMRNLLASEQIESGARGIAAGRRVYAFHERRG